MYRNVAWQLFSCRALKIPFPSLLTFHCGCWEVKGQYTTLLVVACRSFLSLKFCIFTGCIGVWVYFYLTCLRFTVILESVEECYASVFREFFPPLSAQHSSLSTHPVSSFMVFWTQIRFPIALFTFSYMILNFYFICLIFFLSVLHPGYCHLDCFLIHKLSSSVADLFVVFLISSILIFMLRNTI